ncbi:apiosidase-like domain-containing protein [Lacrimispora algidixylanolytica]|uniref:Apiosidase-like catalytic domain-containing protein n=1 Tax=Lacrimispora algidixylanolytica TaxID=94868 RepID=A0A419T9E2_9FIRM|nr:DUF4038 domain-containing protein [Lacrimispora algidixylanolytica]RKD34091.1 hypothetical protein BET01_13125 [Lacrimispora algidixylanolytica]
MSRLKINENGRTFLLDGQRFFYLADTVWSAFTSATMDEWEFYLEKRWSQGFTVLQINIMPQWDRCMSDVGVYPFETPDGITFDYTKWNEAYFDRAKIMCNMAREKGFQLALVILWLNFVPGTWGSRLSKDYIMPKDFIKPYTRKVIEEFEEFEPIYMVSGDTDFDTPESIDYYEAALSEACLISPDSLKAMHIKRGYDYIPETFLDRISFYMFQSGHNADGQQMAYLLAEKFYGDYPKKPVINAEPCYEQMGFSRNMYGRFQPFDIRKAAWSSLLSGACAGVTYGAHGVWNWKKSGKQPNPVMGEGFDQSFPMQEALLFPGAWDYGYIADFMKEMVVDELIPVSDLLEEKSSDIRMAMTTEEEYLIYMPYPTELLIKKELHGYQAKAINLSNRSVSKVGICVTEASTRVLMHSFQEDTLILLKKQ